MLEERTLQGKLQGSRCRPDYSHLHTILHRRIPSKLIHVVASRKAASRLTLVVGAKPCVFPTCLSHGHPSFYHFRAASQRGLFQRQRQTEEDNLRSDTLPCQLSSLVIRSMLPNPAYTSREESSEGHKNDFAYIFLKSPEGLERWFSN